MRTVVIISTKYWDYNNPATAFPLFSKVEVTNIPFWEINGIPKYYEAELIKRLLSILLGQDELKKIILERSGYLRNIPLNQNNADRISNGLKRDFAHNFWEDNKFTIEFFPNGLTFKKVVGHEIYVLPALPDDIISSHDHKNNYIDFLINAWNKSYNIEKEKVNKYLLFLHEKDLGLPPKYREKILDDIDFQENKYLRSYMSESIITKLGSEIDLIVFQHSADYSQLVNNFLTTKTPEEKNLVKELEDIVTFLKVNNNQDFFSYITYLLLDVQLLKDCRREDFNMCVIESNIINKLDEFTKHLSSNRFHINDENQVYLNLLDKKLNDVRLRSTSIYINEFLKISDKVKIFLKLV